MKYFVQPWFWGNTFPFPSNDPRFKSTPYTPQQFADTLKFITSHNYFSALKQYGAEGVWINEPASFNDAWPSGSGGYAANFTEQNVIDFIKSRLDNHTLAVFQKTIFAVVIPHGSLLDIGALGAHSTFTYNGNQVIWFWMYGSNNVNDAMLTATHEIVEAIGADSSAPKELCDDCKDANPKGVTLPRGVTVETYFDASTNKCVAPGSLEPSGRLSYAADILWHNSITNESQIWFMDDNQITTRQTVIDENGNAILVGLPWSIVGAGDLNGDGKADILWHNSANNETQIWFMDGRRIGRRATVIGQDGRPAIVGDPWSIKAAGDFNGNGKDDILWHNRITNETQIWFMDGEKVSDRGTVLGEDGHPILVGDPWNIAGAGDFDGSGKADIIWHNRVTHETQIWFMNVRQIANRRTVIGEGGNTTLIGPPFSIVAIGDYNGDNRADILWHNSATNESQIWFMDGFQAVARRTIQDENGHAIFVGDPWSIVACSLFLAARVPAITVSGTQLQELVVNGQGFTPRGIYQLTLRNVPGRSGDILRTHSVNFDGTFTLREQLALTPVSAGAQLPDIEVIAQDSATGGTVVQHTSPRPFVVR